MLAYAGDAEAGERALAPFRALAEADSQTWSSRSPYPEMFPPDDPDYHPTAVLGRCSSIRSTAMAETIVDYLEASDASMRVAQLRVLGGAIARVPVDATAYAHRAPDHGQRRRVLRG